MEVVAIICLTLIVLAIVGGIGLLCKRDMEFGGIMAMFAIIPVIIIIIVIASIAAPTA